VAISAPTKVAQFATAGTTATSTGAVALTGVVPAGALLVLVASAAGNGRTYTPSSSAGLTFTAVTTPWPNAPSGNCG
jgi:hypothetical protein